MHVRCGSDIFATLAQTGLRGRMVEWIDPVCDGPTPRTENVDQWYDVRARYIAEAYGLDYVEVRLQLVRQDGALVPRDDEHAVVLWFEHDLFDQAILVRILTLVRGTSRPIFLIDSGEHLGPMDASGLARLYPGRTIGDAEFDLAERAWAAYTSPDPHDIERPLRAGTPGLPFLASALLRQMAELPSVHNGLGMTQQLTLEAVNAGARTPREIFQAYMSREDAAWLGDAQFWSRLSALQSMGLIGERYRLTVLGGAVLAGEADAVAECGINRWVGGVHLRTGDAIPRWHPQLRRVVLPA